jgi:hypothetical protein
VVEYGCGRKLSWREDVSQCSWLQKLAVSSATDGGRLVGLIPTSSMDTTYVSVFVLHSIAP